MSFTELLQLVSAPTTGAVIGYFIWREANDRKDRQAETDSRVKLATALEALRSFIMGRHDV